MLTTIHSSSALSGSGSIQWLLQECGAGNPSYDLSYCLGYVGGIGDMMAVNGRLIAESRSNSGAMIKFATCAGNPEPTYGAKVQVFINWANRNPQQWGQQDFVGVIWALRETWPCQQSSE